MSAPPAPHRVVLDGPWRCALVAAASLLLSLWAIQLDPVIDSAGVGNVRTAEYFHGAEWRAGVEAGGQPVYALLAAGLSRLTGMSAAYSGYALNAGFFALLAVGFMVLAAALGGGRPAQLAAVLVVLLFPSLNGFRAGIMGDAAYWAGYIWSLGYFMHYAAAPGRRRLGAWAVVTLAASLFAIQALVFLFLIPLWLYACGDGRYRGARKTAALAAGAAVILCYLLWTQALQSDGSAARLLLHPLERLSESWQELARAWRFRLEGLRRGFLDQYSQGYDNAALLATLLVASAAGLVKTLGLVYTVVAGGVLAVSRRILSATPGYWWRVFAVLSAALLPVPALVGFALDERDAMIAALTILAVVPAALERLWLDRGEGRGRRRWALPVLPVLLVLLLGAGINGLDLRTGDYYLREAGLWLRANAAPGSGLYSNSGVVAYYSGLEGTPPADGYAWREAMNTIQRGAWRDHDYLALRIEQSNAHREGILRRDIDLEPVGTFSNNAGDRVLIFDTRG